MKIPGPAAAPALANIRARTSSSAEEATRTVQQADPRVRLRGESVSVTLSSVEKPGIVPPTAGMPSIFAASADTPINTGPDLPRAAAPVEQRTAQSSRSQPGGNVNGGNSTDSLGDPGRPPENLQTEEQAQAAARQAINAQTETPNNSANTAIAAYQRIFSL